MYIVRFTLFLVLAMTAAAPAQSACSADSYRQFDFWLGAWTVYANGKVAGTNVITKLHGGCVLHEQYETDTGYAGSSYSMYDLNADLWHQTWVDNSGLLLVLDGHVDEGDMVLEGATINSDGKAIDNRITWSANDDGTVRQLWQTREGDDDWTTVFDGTYRRQSKNNDHHEP